MPLSQLCEQLVYAAVSPIAIVDRVCDNEIIVAREIRLDDERQRIFDRLPTKHQLALRLALNMTPESIAEKYSSDGPLEGVLDCLPLVDRDYSRMVYDAFVSSQNVRNRMSLVDDVPAIVDRDKEYGLPLWNRLIGDQSRTVRRYAYETLLELWDDAITLPGPPSESLVYEDGITWHDACNLLRTYVEAEAEGRTYELGVVALAASAALPPADSGPQAPNGDSTTP